MPWGAIEWACRLADRILEGMPIELRRAQAMILFWTFWPAAKWSMGLSKTPPEVVAGIEDGMKRFEAVPLPAKPEEPAKA